MEEHQAIAEAAEEYLYPGHKQNVRNT